MNILTQTTWSPYICGLILGITLCSALLLSDKQISVINVYGSMSKFFFKKKQTQITTPDSFWHLYFALGLILGSFLSAFLSDSFSIRFISENWQSINLQSPASRWFESLIGGAFMGFGGSWARGCATFHGFSGTTQLSVSSWLAIICMIMSAMVVSGFLFQG